MPEPKRGLQNSLELESAAISHILFAAAITCGYWAGFLYDLGRIIEN